MEKEIDAAINYWLEVLRRPLTQRKFDAGDGDINAMAAAHNIIQGPGAPDEAKLAVFAQALRRLAQEEITASRYQEAIIRTDYEPKDILDKAADEAGISTHSNGLWPFKTIVWVEPSLVKVKEGYGAEHRVLYQK
jgi:hypothetical protein